MQKVQLKPISWLKPNDENPRHISDKNFAALIESIRTFPRMFTIRPIVADENGLILGGNQRFMAAKALGLQEVPVLIAEGLDEQKKREFVIKDNLSAGEWDINALRENWEVQTLQDWGIMIHDIQSGVDLTAFFNEDAREPKQRDEKPVVTLLFTEDQYAEFLSLTEDETKTREQVVFDALC